MKPVRLAILWHMHQPLYREPATGTYVLPWVRLHATRAYDDMAWILERHPGSPRHRELHPGAARPDRGLRGGPGPGRAARPLRTRPRRPRARRSGAGCSTPSSWWTGTGRCAPCRATWSCSRSAGATSPGSTSTRWRRPSPAGSCATSRSTSTWPGWASGRSPTTRRCGSSPARERDFEDADVACVLDAQRRILAGVLAALARARRARTDRALHDAPPPPHPPAGVRQRLGGPGAARRGAAPPLRLARRRPPPGGRRARQPRAALRPARRRHVARRGRGLARGARGHGRRGGGLGGLRRGGAAPVAAPREPARRLALPPLARRRRRPGDVHALPRPVHLRPDRLHLRPGPGRRGRRGFHGACTGGRRGLEARRGAGAGHGGGLPRRRERLGALRRAPATTSSTPSTAPSARTPASRPSRSRRPPPGRRVRAISRIHSGSWIEASYRIWIGHREDRLAWTALGRAREAVEAARAAGAPADRVEHALRHLRAAEGSDWYWWYGEDFATENAAEFDALFRGHVLRACELLDLAPPAGGAAAHQAHRPRRPRGQGAARAHLAGATGHRRPDPDFFEWQGAGLHRPGRGRGAMFGGVAALLRAALGLRRERTSSSASTPTRTRRRPGPTGSG